MKNAKTLTEAAGEADPFRRSAAGPVQPKLQVLFNMSDVAGRRAVCWVYGAGRGGSTSLFDTLFTGFLIGLEQRHQRAGGPLYGAKHLGDVKRPSIWHSSSVFIAGVILLFVGLLGSPGTTGNCSTSSRTCCLVLFLYLRVYFLVCPPWRCIIPATRVFSAIGDTKSR